MILGAIEEVRSGHAQLSELDAACGDGDHGTTMLRAMNLLEKTLAEDKQNDLSSLAYNLGWALLGVDGGATGPLLGSLFLGVSEGLGGKPVLDAAGLAEI